MAEFIPHDDPRRKVVVPDETKSGGDNTPQVYQKTNTDNETRPVKGVTNQSTVGESDAVLADEDQNAEVSEREEDIEKQKDELILDVYPYWDKNPLDQYSKPTYHFRMFMTSIDASKEFLRKMADQQATDTNERVGERELESLSFAENSFVFDDSGGEPNAKIIAETASSVISITDVQMESIVAPTRNDPSTTLNFEIELTEPQGVTILEQMWKAAYILGLDNFYDSPVFLELWMIGAKKGGEDAGQPTRIPHTNRLWALKFNKFSYEVTERGSVTKCSAAPYGEQAKESGIVNIPKNIKLSGIDTLQNFCDRFSFELNELELDRLAVDKFQTDSFEIRIDEAIKNLKSAQLKGETLDIHRKMFSDDAKTTDNPEQDQKSTAQAQLKSAEGTQSIYIYKGQTVQQTILDVLASTDYCQNLVVKAKGAQSDSTDADALTEKNIMKQLLSTVFTINVDVIPGDFDVIRNTYAKTYIYTITPYNTFKPRNDTSDITQEEMLKILQEQLKPAEKAGDKFRGNKVRGLCKIYDYIYTGVNDKVMDFNIEYNNQYFMPTEALKGVFRSIKGSVMHKSWEADYKLLKSYKEKQSALKELFRSYKASYTKMKSFPPGSEEYKALQETVKQQEAEVKKQRLAVKNEYLKTVGSDSDEAKRLVGADQELQNYLNEQTDGTGVGGEDLSGQTQQQRADKVYGSGNPRLGGAKQQLPSSYIGNAKAYIEQIPLSELKTAFEKENTMTRIPMAAASYFQNEADADESPESKVGKLDPNSAQSVLGFINFKAAETQAFILQVEEMVQASMTIRGDPFWIMPSDKYYNPDTTHAMNPYCNTSEIVFNFYNPVRKDADTGLTTQTLIDDNGKLIARDDFTSSLYQVTRINHSFSGGLFTQQLQMIRSTRVFFDRLGVDFRNPASGKAQITRGVVDSITGTVSKSPGGAGGTQPVGGV